MKRRNGIIAGLLLMAVCVILLAMYEMFALLTENRSATNLLDEYYLALATGSGNFPPGMSAPGREIQQEEHAYGIRQYFYSGQNETKPENSCSIQIILDENRRTVKWIQASGDHWYRYLYDANSKTLNYSTNDHTATQRNEFLFAIVLPNWLKANSDSDYSMDIPGVWNGEQMGE